MILIYFARCVGRDYSDYFVSISVTHILLYHFPSTFNYAQKSNKIRSRILDILCPFHQLLQDFNKIILQNYFSLRSVEIGISNLFLALYPTMTGEMVCY